MNGLTVAGLPRLLALWAEAVGIEPVLAIARTFGGRRLYLPEVPKPDHPLAELIGIEAMATLCARFGRRRYDIPSVRTYLRWADARRLKEEGLSHAEISAALGVNLRQVSTLLAGRPPPRSG
ncbi:MAG TPA: hypothetical protein VKT70_08575 [Stellaceae bacterium]|nr:hypothetical protein [Stellaceae bacterium]